VDGQREICEKVEEDPDAGGSTLTVLLHAGCMFSACASIERKRGNGDKLENANLAHFGKGSTPLSRAARSRMRRGVGISGIQRHAQTKVYSNN
jgi:hypothetical protein